jgi:hypothetical protein
MAGVTDKKTYLQRRIELLISRFTWLQERYGDDPALQAAIRDKLGWALARRQLFLGERGAKKAVWKNRKNGLSVSLFEIVTSTMPDSLFMCFIRLAKKNII